MKLNKIYITSTFASNQSQERVLYPIHDNKTCLVKQGLSKWKAARKEWETQFYIGSKHDLTCVFTMVNLKSKTTSVRNLSRQNNFKPCLTK